MSFESDNAQRNTTLDRLKQRTPPTSTDQQPSVLYTMPMTTVARLEEVLRRTLTLQETIRAVRGRQGDEVQVLLSAKKETKTP